MKINTKSFTEQHASWLASNPVVGCPMSCEYCFLKSVKLNEIKPKILTSPKKAIDDLISFRFYSKDVPVATGTRTDFFATLSTINYLKDYIIEYNKRHLQNPLIIITKKKIPDDIIHLFTKLQNQGSTFIIFLSYSGLNNTIEKGVNTIELKNNFKRLNKAKLHVIHYWRPFVPQNSELTIMESVIKHVIKYADASVVAGLRFTPDMRGQFKFWPQVQTLNTNLDNIEGVWPRKARDNLEYLAQKYPTYPIVYASSCAIANSLGIPDYNGFYNTQVCKINSCPTVQREICTKFFIKYVVTDAVVEKVFKKLKIKNINYTLNNKKRTLVIDEPLNHNQIAYLSQTLKISIKAKEKGNDYGWSSSLAQRKPYYI